MRYFASIIMVAFLATLFSAAQGFGQTGREGVFQQDPEQQRVGMQGQVSPDQLTSSQVRELQQSLQQQGADPGPIDGIMGPLTQDAIRDFQQDEGIAATGQLDRETLEALDLDVQEFMGAAPAFGEEQQRGVDQRGTQQQRGVQQRDQQQVSPEQLTSSQVRELQQSLQQQGADPGPIDGIMGPMTQDAIREFQQDEGIAATGQLDQQTLEALDLDVQEFMGVAPGFEQREQRQQREQPGVFEMDRDTQRDGIEQRDPQPGRNGMYR